MTKSRYWLREKHGRVECIRVTSNHLFQTDWQLLFLMAIFYFLWANCMWEKSRRQNMLFTLYFPFILLLCSCWWRVFLFLLYINKNLCYTIIFGRIGFFSFFVFKACFNAKTNSCQFPCSWTIRIAWSFSFSSTLRSSILFRINHWKNEKKNEWKTTFVCNKWDFGL